MSTPITLFNGLELSPRRATARATRDGVSRVAALVRLVDRMFNAPTVDRRATVTPASCSPGDAVRADLALEVDPFVTSARRRVCVMSLVRSVTNRLALRVADAGVDLFIQCGGGVLMGDESALGAALFHLVAHAIHASREGSQVVLETVKTRDGDQYWVLHHAGRGFAVEPLAGPAAPLCDWGAGGSTDGLALTREAVARHGGRLSVASCTDSQTTLTTIWLPHESALVRPQPWQEGAVRAGQAANRCAESGADRAELRSAFESHPRAR